MNENNKGAENNKHNIEKRYPEWQKPVDEKAVVGRVASFDGATPIQENVMHCWQQILTKKYRLRK